MYLHPIPFSEQSTWAGRVDTVDVIGTGISIVAVDIGDTDVPRRTVAVFVAILAALSHIAADASSVKPLFAMAFRIVWIALRASGTAVVEWIGATTWLANVKKKVVSVAFSNLNDGRLGHVRRIF